MTSQESLSPEFGHSRVIAIPSVNDSHLEYFENNSITFFVFGCQEDSPPDPRLEKLNTKVRSDAVFTIQTVLML